MDCTASAGRSRCCSRFAARCAWPASTPVSYTHLPDLDVRVIHAGAPNGDALAVDEGTRLYTALTRGLADVPRQRIAGAVMITDGEIHDMPPPERLDFRCV